MNTDELKIITKILIVDDSRLYRSLIEEAISGEEYIRVIGSVRNGKKAMELINTNRPDIVTLDMEMPEMDGLTTLKQIERYNVEHPHCSAIRVIIVSTPAGLDDAATFKAKKMKAFDFILKPDSLSADKNNSILRSQLLNKIKQPQNDGQSNLVQPSPALNRSNINNDSIKVPPRYKAIFIGVSTGGPKALNIILPELTRLIDIPIFIAQHMPSLFTQSMSKSLDKLCLHTVKEGENEEIVTENFVYIAPGGKHMLVKNSKGHRVKITINQDAPVDGCRPSVNLLFNSAAAVYGKSLIAIILTGMGSDGTDGLLALKKKGAYSIAQNEKSSTVWGMPGSAVAAGCIDSIVPLEKIPAKVAEILYKSPVC